jgi:hypothetical protein
MKTGTDVAAHCKMTPANIIIAPMNRVTLRPKRSDTRGPTGRACNAASISKRRACMIDGKLTDKEPKVWAVFIRPVDYESCK